MSSLADLAYTEISSDLTGNRELNTIKELSIDLNESSTKVAKAMTRKRRPIGYTDGIPNHEFEMKAWVPKGTPEVDWVTMMRKKIEFNLTYEEGEGGQRFTLVTCRITSVSKPFTEEGEFMVAIKCLALDHRPAKAQ